MTGPRMRAGDADRQAAVDRLTEHLTAGRLDLTEFDQRVAKAYAATYLDELPALFSDLPDLGGPAGKAGRGSDGRKGFATATPWTPGFGTAGSAGGMSGRPGGSPTPPGRPQMPPGSTWAGRFGRLVVVAIMVMVVLALLVESRGFILLPLIFIGMGVFRGGRRGRQWSGRPPWR